MDMVVRFQADPSTLVEPIRETVQSLNPNLPLFDVRSMDDVLAGSIADRRFLSNVADDADDRERWGWIKDQLATDRILVRPVTARRRLVDQNDGHRTAFILHGESTATDERDFHRLEIAGQDRPGECGEQNPTACLLPFLRF